MRIVALILAVALFGTIFLFPSFRYQFVHKVQNSWSYVRHKVGDHTSLMDRLPQRPRPVPRGSFPRVKPPPARMLVPVTWSNPPRSFFTTRRTPHLTRYSCKHCHDGSMGTKRSPQKFQATHGSIVLKHASPGVLQCTSCHNRSDMNKLRTPTGAKVSMDRSYLLCASCHTRQAKDWAGGAHGKRETFWAGKRVVRSCTGCHNPHQPLFGKRWPKTFFRPPNTSLRH